ncbi:hypothetical protein K443DRAFT_84620 [Laccaria amethystina LaAM-08-1]|uniref:Unplaced genomic scaffold K443scaffold_6, whole genome shotgun sequence n=1 Tax=Laccaria amethystina LaAM-08-1 TaxID=1095629 RepID=A0A0C9YL24_9AGAR|nr:hypothetical protein K443DRAFT_84620 [Laccaria amethystina LaAM-08-1]
MTTPPGESSPDDPSQPLPHQPPLPTQAPTLATKKPRQRKRADPKEKQSKAQARQQEEEAELAEDSPPPTQCDLQSQTQNNNNAHSTATVYASPPPGAIFQPYPYIMNPPYPINGTPYSQHPQFPPQAPQQINTGPPSHGHQYAYPMHPSPYPPYTPYPQYQPMVMYSTAPRPSAPPEIPYPAPSPVANSAGGKRKRKPFVDGSRSGKGASDEEGPSGSDVGRGQQAQQQAQAQALNDLKKRTKTDPPVCQHCKQYSFECTFFLPITETRFKKKKTEEEVPDKDKAESSRSLSAHVEPQAKRDVGMSGPTSPAHLLHSQATISSRVYETYDQRYHHTFKVSKSGDGLIQVQKPVDEQPLTHPKSADLHIEREVIEKLINAYFSDVAPILPIITKAEFLQSSNPSPILLYSMCLVAAARREVPQKVFDSIRFAVNSIIKADDVLSTASIVNVQALLILCMTGDCHSQFVPTALSALWIRLGTAIRMAQDLGLHRTESLTQNIEHRRRLWGACLICDRWTSIAYGHPYMIDVQDCDARLPSSGDLNDLYLDELVRLSIIIGRVQKVIYSPSGLTFTTDAMLHELFADMKRWKEGLPDHLKFRGAETSQNAGLLHFLFACVGMMFWRVFMRISYSCPSHLKFGLTVEQWSELVALTADCIDWLDAHERVYDVWLPVAYAATSCALVQYHTCIRRKDEDAQAKLRKLRDCVRRWEGALSPDHMSARRKAAEIIALLYEATQGPPLPLEAPVLNPTGGVTVKQPVMLDYRKDPTRPGGGVFIAHGKTRTREDIKDVSEGTIISAPSEEDSSEGKAESQAAAISAPIVSRSMASGSTSAPLVNFTSLASGGERRESFANVNPAMNLRADAGSVQLMNVLDAAQGGNNLADFAMADTEFLAGIPGQMFDWGQWDTFFSRFGSNSGQDDPSFQQPRMQMQPEPQNLPPRFT